MTLRELKDKLEFLTKKQLDQELHVLDSEGRAYTFMELVTSPYEYYISGGCKEAIYTKNEVQNDIDLGYSGWEDYELFAPKGGFYLEVD